MRGVVDQSVQRQITKLQTPMQMDGMHVFVKHWRTNMIEEAKKMAQRLRNLEYEIQEEAADTIDALVAENEAIRTLMNCYNVGGWTDSLTLIKERDEARAEVERLKQEQAESVVIASGCFERGCACYDLRVDNDGVKVYEQRK